MKRVRPLKIALDGPDGVGKTTQVDALSTYLTELGHKVHTTRASGGTPIGEALRKVSLSKTPRPPYTDLYISLAMHQALGEDLQARSKTGETVIVDRSPLAIIAYNGFGSQISNKTVAFDACSKMLKLWELDLLILLMADQPTLNSRRQQRQKKDDYFESQDNQYHNRVREGYDRALKKYENQGLGTKFVEIDASQSITEVKKAIRRAIDGLTP